MICCWLFMMFYDKNNITCNVIDIYYCSVINGELVIVNNNN